MQAEQRDTEMRLKPVADHIRQAFSGDERFMILQTYYRQNGYKQTDVLKGSVALLLEVPFFIAAYRFLSGLDVLQGVRFGPIADLGLPDGLLRLGSLRLNFLPVLMTAVNLVSAGIYMKGFPLKNKLQMVGMALVFLVLLYGSPAGLVLYWTLNNVFSLLKNIFYKLRHPDRVLRILFALCGGAGLVFLFLVHPLQSRSHQILGAAFFAALLLPLLLRVAGKKRSFALPTPKEDRRLFLLGSLFLAALTGLLIPSTLIGSSPDEFVFLGAYFSPYWYILSSCLLAAGTFLIWVRIFYELADEKGRGWLCLAILLLSVAAAVDYLVFGTHYGNMSDMLRYDLIPKVELRESLLNLLAICAAGAVFAWLWKKKPALVRTALLAAVIAILLMSGLSAARIPDGIGDKNLGMKSSTDPEDWPHIELSREGKNVVILMMDRSVGCYLPYLFAERPELQEQFAGFRYYPNTISYGHATREAAPALYGGYEYTPAELEERGGQSILEKHNEALKVMPVLFAENGYQVTVLNPPFAGYRWYPDLSIYADYPEIEAVNTYGMIDGSQLESPLAEEFGENFFGWQERNETALLRNFFCHSIFRIAPSFLQPTLYNMGYYNASQGLAEADPGKSYNQVSDSLSTARGRDPGFVNSYDVMVLLSELTRLNDEPEGCFVMLANEITHSPCLLQTPDYRPTTVVDNREYDAAHALRPGFEGQESLRLRDYIQVSHYHVNMAAMIRLGYWMDWLREQGVYDNTRIIIVGDHGTHLDLREEDRFGPELWEDISFYNPLLMVKDFGSGEFTVDERFMTNADVPLLAFADLVPDPCNPFTGNPITDEIKQRPVQLIYGQEDWDGVTGAEKRFPAGYWYSFSGDRVYDPEAWSVEDFR